MADAIARANAVYNTEELEKKLEAVAQLVDSWAATMAGLHPKLDEARAALADVRAHVGQLVHEKLVQMEEEERQVRAAPAAPSAQPAPPAAAPVSAARMGVTPSPAQHTTRPAVPPPPVGPYTPSRTAGPGARRSDKDKDEE
jgi:hypothetical protein